MLILIEQSEGTKSPRAVTVKLLLILQQLCLVPYI